VRRVDFGALAIFWLCVGMVLAFSQCWVMLLTGPLDPPVPAALSAALRNFFFPVYAAVLGLALMRPRGSVRAMLRSPALMLLLAVAVASITWSIDREVTARRCIAVLFTTFAALVLAERFAWPRFLEVFATAFGITVVLSFFLALFVPEYGVMQSDFPGAWRGAWSHKNTLGFYMSVSLIVFIASAIANPRRRWLWLLGAAAALLLILLSQSKTSLASCMIGLACMPLMAAARRGPAWAIAATYLAVSVLAGLAIGFYMFPDYVLGLLGKDATLTGRTDIWAAVLRQIAHRPLTGYGYGAVWDNTSAWGPLPWISKEQGFVIHEAHNTMLGLWLDIGLVGLGAWLLLFLSVWVRAIRELYRPGSGFFAVPFLAVFSLHTLTESVALVQNDLIWLIFAATAVKLSVGERTAPANARSTEFRQATGQRPVRPGPWRGLRP
jgi:O-antigen ligase